MGLTVILPAFNEEPAIGKVIDEIQSLGLDYQIIVVDNNSTDQTAKVALSKGIAVIHEPEQGKGNAFRWGLRQVTTPYVAMVNSDFTYPTIYIDTLLRLLKHTDSEAAIGYRDNMFPNSMTRINQIGNYLLSWIATILYGKRVYDVCSGLWVFKTSVIQSLPITSKGFTLEADIYSNLRKQGYKIIQFPIHYRARLDGSRPKLKVRDGFRIGWFLIRRRFS